MKRYLVGLTALCFCIACDQPKKQTAPIVAETRKPVDHNLMITPGGGIGKVTIGENTEDVISALGKPDGGDAAMGSQMIIWYDNHDKAGHRLTVFSHRPMGGPKEAISEVKAIRATSPKFSTTGNVHVGLPISDIKSHFNLKRSKSSAVTIYTDNNSGIAFETDAQQKCTAIIVFARGGLVDTYLNMRDN